MNGRLGIISGAAFAGVVAAAVLIGGVPGFAVDDDEGREGNRSNTGVLVPIGDPASVNQAVSAADSPASATSPNNAFLVESGAAYYGGDDDEDEHEEHDEHERGEREHEEDDD